MQANIFSSNQSCQYLNMLIKQSLQNYQQGLPDDAAEVLGEFKKNFDVTQLIEASYIELNLLFLSLVKLRDESNNECVALWIVDLIEAYQKKQGTLPDFVWDIGLRNRLFIARQRNPELARHNELSRLDEKSLARSEIGSNHWRKNLELLSRYREQSDDYPTAKKVLVELIGEMAAVHEQCKDQERALYRVNTLSGTLDSLMIAIQNKLPTQTVEQLQQLKLLWTTDDLLMIPKWMSERFRTRLNIQLDSCLKWLAEASYVATTQPNLSILCQTLKTMAEALNEHSPSLSNADEPSPVTNPRRTGLLKGVCDWLHITHSETRPKVEPRWH